MFPPPPPPPPPPQDAFVQSEPDGGRWVDYKHTFLQDLKLKVPQIV